MYDRLKFSMTMDYSPCPKREIVSYTVKCLDTRQSHPTDTWIGFIMQIHIYHVYSAMSGYTTATRICTKFQTRFFFTD